MSRPKQVMRQEVPFPVPTKQEGPSPDTTKQPTPDSQVPEPQPMEINVTVQDLLNALTQKELALIQLAKRASVELEAKDRMIAELQQKLAALSVKGAAN